MALHGDIRINGSLIGVWQARRTQRLWDVEAVHTYECRVDWVDDTEKTGMAFLLDHRYSEGATALAAKVLQQASPAAPTAPGVKA
jgi:hypothetical protein